VSAGSLSSGWSPSSFSGEKNRAPCPSIFVVASLHDLWQHSLSYLGKGRRRLIFICELGDFTKHLSCFGVTHSGFLTVSSMTLEALTESMDLKF